MSKRFLAMLAAASLAIVIAAAPAAANQGEATLDGANFIARTQQADGGFGGFGPGQSFDAILALRSAGIDPNSISGSGTSAGAYLASVAPTLEGAGALGKAALAAHALGMDPRNVAGIDLIAAIDATYDPTTGHFAEDAFSQSLAILGEACTGTAAPSVALAALRDARTDDGGWGFGGFSDPDTTALGIQALLAGGAGASDSAVQGAVALLRSTQGGDGGWGFDPTGPSNTSSTAFAVQALIAAGEDPGSATYTRGGVTPIGFLLSQQGADGSFAGFDPAYATNQVVPALAGRTFCNAATTVINATVTGPANPPAPPATGTGLAGDGTPATPLFVAGIAIAAVLGWQVRRTTRTT